MIKALALLLSLSTVAIASEKDCEKALQDQRAELIGLYQRLVQMPPRTRMALEAHFRARLSEYLARSGESAQTFWQDAAVPVAVTQPEPQAARAQVVVDQALLEFARELLKQMDDLKIDITTTIYGFLHKGQTDEAIKVLDVSTNRMALGEALGISPEKLRVQFTQEDGSRSRPFQAAVQNRSWSAGYSPGLRMYFERLFSEAEYNIDEIYEYETAPLEHFVSIRDFDLARKCLSVMEERQYKNARSPTRALTSLMTAKYLTTKTVNTDQDIDQMLELLFKSPILDVNLGDRIRTPLIIAVQVAAHKGDFSILRWLLNHPQIDVHAQGYGGETPLFTAITMGSPEAVSVLLEKGANPLISGFANRELALSFAIKRSVIFNSSQYVKIVEMLLKHPSVDVNDVDANGDSALHTAIEKAHWPAARVLLSHPDIDLTLRSKTNGTPLEFVRAARSQTERFDVPRHMSLARIEAALRWRLFKAGL